MSFNLTPFWVQVHEILVRFMNKAVAEGICKTMGEVSCSTKAPTEECGSFMRVRVLVDISHPLYQGRVITLDDNRELWVSFKYERLPNLCYWCGCLTHDDRDCERWIDSEGILDKSKKWYGSWLRAAPFNGVHRGVVSIPGLYPKKKVSPIGRNTPMEARTVPASQSLITDPCKESASEGITSNSNLRDPFHTKGQLFQTTQSNPDLVQQIGSKDLFEKHIEEIGRDLRKIELPIGDDHEYDMPGNTSTSLCSIYTPISMHTNPSQIPNPTPSPPIILEDISKPNNFLKDSAPLSTWKRIPRVDKVVTKNQTAMVGQKRTNTNHTSHSDLPNKKIVVSQNDIDNI